MWSRCCSITIAVSNKTHQWDFLNFCAALGLQKKQIGVVGDTDSGKELCVIVGRRLESQLYETMVERAQRM